MKIKIPGTFLVLAGLALAMTRGNAQTYWQLTYTGTASHTNELGKVVTESMTDRTLIQRCAQAGGTSDTSNLALVLHVNGNVVGDTVEVVNVNDPNLFRCEVFKLAFPAGITNSSGTQVKNFTYIYNNDSDIFADPSAHSRGSAVVTRGAVAKHAAPNTNVITGKLQFWLGEWIDNAPATNAIVCSGTFTGKPLSLP